MKKFLVFSCVSFSSLMLIGCARTPAIAKRPAHPAPVKSVTVELDRAPQAVDESKENEYTHVLAEADAEDSDIRTETGNEDIDDEIEAGNEGEEYRSIPFLKNKKTKRMQFWVDYFTKKQRERFQRFINNGEEYRHHIEAELDQHGLPRELYYVGLIESGYYLGARSHAGAQGPWQFIKGTGTRYGLRITSELDERQDLFKATKAAAMYFKDLHNVFSSWELALSAYNAGEYGIIRRIMKHGTRDFYELSRNKQLPSETINYVPKVLAAMHVIQNAEKYGFDIPKKKYRMFDRTELRPVQKNLPLATLAKRLNVDVNLLKKLNPELKGNATPKHLAGQYFLRIPQSKYSYRLGDLEQKIATTEPASTPVQKTVAPARAATPVVKKVAPVAAKAPTTHKVKGGETLISIARKYSVTPRHLAEANNFKSWKTRLNKGQVLNLVKAEPQTKVQRMKRPITYQIKSGDNLTTIAELFNTDVGTIKTANKLKSGKIMVGQSIVLPNTKKAIYTVKPGDHLTKVARDFNWPIEALIKLNDLKRKTIYPGQKLIVNMD
jgi:membrane-bound lytic murein transglycosylase D